MRRPRRGTTEGADVEGARDVSLDRLRALAILLVVVFHVAQMWPSALPRLTRVTALGAHGVDLFFVLSGWLIGGLFWRELAARRTVDVPRFILRRILRTVPCYLVALGLSWGAVRAMEPGRAAFDPAYLLFLQNYERTMPFFLVSWSLCIEEHFYLLMPLVLITIWHVRPRWLSRLWPLCLLPLLLRAFQSPADVDVFSSAWTATHLRFEGLLAGVLAAWLARNHAAGWVRATRLSRVLVLPLLGLAIALFFASRHAFYELGVTVLALGFLSLLVAGVSADARPGVGHRLVKIVAVSSYSAYLTHALMIHVARRAVTRLAVESNGLRLLVFAAAIAGGAAAFYWLVERPALAFRDRFVPRQARAGSSATLARPRIPKAGLALNLPATPRDSGYPTAAPRAGE